MAAIRQEVESRRRPSIVPQVPYEDIRAALSFLERAFGFREVATSRMVSADGRILHSYAEFGDSMIGIGSQGATARSARRPAGALVSTSACTSTTSMRMTSARSPPATDRPGAARPRAGVSRLRGARPRGAPLALPAVAERGAPGALGARRALTEWACPRPSDRWALGISARSSARRRSPRSGPGCTRAAACWISSSNPWSPSPAFARDGSDATGRPPAARVFDYARVTRLGAVTDGGRRSKSGGQWAQLAIAGRWL